MVKNDICLGGTSKQNGLFPKKCAPKNVPMPSLSRISPARKKDMDLRKVLEIYVRDFSA